MTGFTAEQIMLKMGFPETENGPYVTALRAQIAKQVANGLTNRSGGTWARDDFTCEQRAKAILAMDWEMEHGHGHCVECLDGIRSWRDIPRIPYWIADRFREGAYLFRRWRDRHIVNPYA